ncbi:Zn-dependent protease with chaperone function [Bacillus mesophilus]|uniref:M48 family metallopeptidase n=1 Tax=Bacillus mesophilus TaxID=1808955 RepID=A0A6M0Q3E2_9BACI|nr:M48 family metallopeptidase [Bacillus mesophilus]MBM7659853.1 Zn-dependent protease with chaperone function [Bacillus mesophilus]NEY70712.1 M48 family metallopeptidase [Bacillus mesophilus]
MKKAVWRSVLVYVLFSVVMSLYIFQWADTSIPSPYQGTAADPATFMTEQQLLLSEDYSKVRNVLYFLTTPYEWLLLFVLLGLGLSAKIQSWSQMTVRVQALQICIYLFWMTLFTTILTLPFKLYGYNLSKEYGINVQPFQGWMKDFMLDFWINFFITAIIVVVLYSLMKKSAKRWWLYAWFLSIPFTLFLTFIQPVYIDPLYNDFYPLKDKQLEAQILSLADEAGIPAAHVFEVNMSEKTNAMNAYVNGIGDHSRIVLWDTTLNKLNDQEVLFIMAHEMGHYVKKHVFLGIISYLAVSLAGLYLIYRLMNFIIRVWGSRIGINHTHDIATIPLFFLLLSLLSFLFTPISNTVSRHHEIEADRYAVELTGDQTAAVGSFQELSKSNLSQVNPPLIVKIFRYTHPTMLERIHYLDTYEFKEIEKK